MKKYAAIAAVCALAGCAGINYAMENYSGVPVQRISHDDRGWRVYDKPQEGRLMITPSLGDSAGAGAATGLTLGLATSPYVYESTFKPTVQAYLAQKHGNGACRITSADLVVKPQFEFFYEC